MSPRTRSLSRAQVLLVFARPELVGGVFRHLPTVDRGTLRLACNTVREASRPLLTKLDVRLSCLTGFPAADALRLRRMEHVRTLELHIVDSYLGDPFPEDCAGLMRAVLDTVRWVHVPSSLLVVRATPAISTPVCVVLQTARCTGTTVIAAPVVKMVPLLRILPRAPPPALMLATTTLQNHIGMNWSLQKVALGGYAPDRLVPPLQDERSLGPFASDLMPNLVSLSLTFRSKVCLDLSEELGADLSQLRKLRLLAFELVETGLEGLSDAAPHLTGLTIASRNLLAVPDLEPAPWPGMRKMHLSVEGRVTPADGISYRHHDFTFPGEALPFFEVTRDRSGPHIGVAGTEAVRGVAGGLEELTVGAGPGQFLMPFASTTLPDLRRLQRLALHGVRFLTPSLSGLTSLRTLTIRDVDVMSSDYSSPAHQVALHCRRLERLDIGGYPSVVSGGQAHLSSSGLLLAQLHRALKRRVPRDWRLWKGVPLVIREFDDPFQIPNDRRRPVFVSLERQSAR
ncbi:hypothetical protein WJX74_003167 [Apatococcus lobatus]|uniref:F-box domain-containing protein n=1 Tax=Apatococcus lobatus TaxID=904363 RepID=A0AAW1PQZ5_9CHLO